MTTQINALGRWAQGPKPLLLSRCSPYAGIGWRRNPANFHRASIVQRQLTPFNWRFTSRRCGFNKICMFPAHAGWFTVIWIQADILPLIHFGSTERILKPRTKERLSRKRLNYLTYRQRKTMDLLGTHALSAPIPIGAGRRLGAGSLPDMPCDPFRYSPPRIATQ